jgi:excisionase family DNA binding protein
MIINEISISEIKAQLDRIERATNVQKSVLTFEETSKYTGLSKSTLYKLTSTGGVPCYCPQGKKLYFNKVELEQWLLRNKKETSDILDKEASRYVTLNKKGGVK